MKTLILTGKRSLSRTSDRGRLLSSLILLSCGLTFAGVWTDVVGYSTKLFINEQHMFNLPYSADAFQLGRLAVSVVFILAARKLAAAQNQLTVLTVLLMSTATGAVVISYHQNLVDPYLLASCGIFVASAGYSFLVWIFYYYAARFLPTPSIIWCIAVSLILETVLSILASLYLSPTNQMILVTIAPICSALCYLFGTRVDSKRLTINGKTLLKTGQQTQGFAKYALIIQVIAFTVTLVFIRALSAIGTWGGTRSNFTGMTELSLAELSIISATILVLTLLVFALPGRRLPIPLCCIIGLAAILIALQILALSNEFQFDSSFDAITTAAELFSHLVRWMIIIECVRSVDTPPYRIVGLGFAVAALLTMLWGHVVQPLTIATSSLVMIIVYILLMTVTLLSFLSGSFSRNNTKEPSPDDRTQTDYLNFARCWSLTPRETELFILLMQGCKRADIGQQCGLSEGTVKTHITNIYKKLDIHSKRELHQVFEQSRLRAQAHIADDNERTTLD